jgi:protein-S-isoprenylcysteine O-methyltransferase Ste14
MRQKHFIDSNKAVTAFFVLLLMAIYNQWQNPTAWIYLALHGTYGFLWLLKSRIFPDNSWEQKSSLAYGLVIWAGLCLYWLTPWLITSQNIQAPAWYQALCISIYAFGVFTHFASDMQKTTALKLRPGELITDGMFARLRNPNYFGELLIYSGFGLLAMHWLPILVLLVWIGFIWIPRMLRKEKVLGQLPGFEQYKAHSKMFLPFLF